MCLALAEAVPRTLALVVAAMIALSAACWVWETFGRAKKRKAEEWMP